MKRVKRYVREHKFELIESAVIYTTSVVCYSYACKRFGYRMVRPTGFDEHGQPVFKSITGKTVRVKIID